MRGIKTVSKHAIVHDIKRQMVKKKFGFHKILALCDSLSPSASALLFLNIRVCLFFYAATIEMYILFYLNSKL